MEFIVGTVLAGVPVVLEAYNRYWDLSKGFNTFRHYSKELVKLDTILNTQKTLFRGNIIKLLTAITNDPDRARRLLRDGDKEAWEALRLDGISGDYRLESLRDTFTSWKATLDQVLSSVTAICLEVESFRISNVLPAESALSREALKQLRKRFRLCWRKNEVQDSIKELREFTADFNELTARISSELKEIQGTNILAKGLRRPLRSSNLDRYRQIQSASLRLYNALAQRWSCSKHSKHAASISLVEYTSNKPKAEENRVKFDVAIACDVGSPISPESVIWLEVETVDTRAPTRKTAPSSADSEMEWESTIRDIAGHIQGASGEKLDTSDMVDSASGGKISTPFPAIDLEILDDAATGTANFPGRYHLVDISEDEFTRSLPRTTMVHLAGSLAAAVLQSHSTPWLPKTWESSQVLFFGGGDALEDAYAISSMSPYLNVGFSTVREAMSIQEMDMGRKAIANPPEAGDSAIPTPAPSSLARNAILFRLGIILLELGYSQPWQHLRKRLASAVPPQHQSDCDAAEKLAQAPLLRNRMGPRFSIIVRKCLGCDFGLGENDLASEKLQGMFLVEVVEALQETERGLKELEGRLGSAGLG